MLYDGVVMDEQDYSVLGGQAEQIIEALKEQYQPGMSLGDALKLGAKVLGTDDSSLTADQLEVALLDRSRPRRAFRRIKNDELDHAARVATQLVPAQQQRDRTRDQHEQDQRRDPDDGTGRSRIGGRSSSRISSASSTSATSSTRLASSN